MGAVCCCLNPQDFEEYTAFRNGSMDQNCVCLRRCVCGFLRMVSSPSLSDTLLVTNYCFPVLLLLGLGFASFEHSSLKGGAALCI